MMGTGLSIVQGVCYRMNLSAPSSLVGSTDPNALQWLHCLYDVARDLRQFGIWPQQKRTHTFTTVSSQASYQLPRDFYAFLLGTHWDQTNDIELRGPVSDEDWNMRVYGVSVSTGDYAYRIFGGDEHPGVTDSGQFWLNPTPDSTDTISFDYVSRNVFWPTIWLASTAFAAASHCSASGYIYYTAAGGTTGATKPSHTSGTQSDGGVSWVFDDAPYETMLADTDYCVFDDDLVQLGLEAKYLKQKGGNYQPVEMEYRNRMNQAVARMRGVERGSFADVAKGPRYRTQEGSWTFP